MKVYIALVHYQSPNIVGMASFEDKEDAVSYLSQIYIEDKENWDDPCTKEELTEMRNGLREKGGYEIPYTVTYYLRETKLHTKEAENEQR